MVRCNPLEDPTKYEEHSPRLFRTERRKPLDNALL